MAWRLARLPQKVAIVDPPSGKPTMTYQRWQQTHAEKTETAINDIIDILTRLGLVEVTADGALELADSAINPDGTIKTSKVVTDSVASNAITAPWLAIDNTVITVGSTATTILTQSITKAEDGSLLEVSGQVPLVGSDAVKVIVTYAVKSGVTTIATRDFTLEVDANGATYLPFSYEHYFDGIDAGTYDVVLTCQLTTANTCTTDGTYHMRIREFKR